MVVVEAIVVVAHDGHMLCQQTRAAQYALTHSPILSYQQGSAKKSNTYPEQSQLMLALSRRNT